MISYTSTRKKLPGNIETTRLLLDAGVSYYSFDWVTSLDPEPTLLVFISGHHITVRMEELRRELLRSGWLIKYLPPRQNGVIIEEQR